MKHKRRVQPAIGWREWVKLPDLGIGRIKAKIDTGARTSALHAYDLETVTVEGVPRIRFSVHPFQRDTETTIRCEAPLLEERRVRSSTGKSTLRPVIVTLITIGPHSWPIEITLIRRDMMGFRMLLGRHAIRRKFVVDPGRSFLMGRIGHGQGPVSNKQEAP